MATWELSVVFSAASESTAKQRNVLLLCIDDLRPVLGCYGGAAKTPNMDALAESGAAFTRHYVQWPVCGPSRASMLGGLRPDSTGIYEIGDSWQISKRPDTHPTMPRYFQDNGYKTLSFGKVFHGQGRGKGFGWSEDPWKLDWTCYINFENEEGKSRDIWRPAYEIYEGADSLHNDYQTADRVIEALKANKDRPFFIAGGFFKPHLPFVAPQKYRDLYSEDEISAIEPLNRAEGAGDFMYNWTEISAYGDSEGNLFSSDADVGNKELRAMIHAYYACVSFIDHQVGRILQALEYNGLADDTAVLIWGDHGFHLGDHGRWAKHTQFEQSMRSPLIVRLPGVQKIKGETQAIVESVDIYPTLCEYVGIEIPDFVDGASMLSTISGDAEGKPAAFSQIRPVNRRQVESQVMAYSVRTENFRYVEWRQLEAPDKVVWRELYDHMRDPEETISVIENPEYARVVKAHEKLVRENYASQQSRGN